MPGLQETIDQALHSADSPVTATVDAILAQAREQRASDVHLEPTGQLLNVSFRIDGVLQSLAHLPLELAENITSRVKVMAGLITYRTDVPQDGRIQSEDGHSDLRVSILPTTHGEKAVIRIFDSGTALFDLEELGFPEEVKGRLTALLQQPSGVLLLTGPSGSGKTTTIYSLLKKLTGQSHHRPNIVTIEDPVEHDIAGVTQTQVNPAAGLTFAAGLRSLLRQDPEVIVIGEIRDRETAQIAVEAGLTGHLVISTIHSGTACGVFARLLEMGIEPYLLTSSLCAVLAQRLLRKLCIHCRKAVPKEQWPEKSDFPMGSDLYESAGCPRCLNTGYWGRFPVVELLEVDEGIRGLILQKASRILFENHVEKAQQATLWQRGVECVSRGGTSWQELLRLVPRSD